MAQNHAVAVAWYLRAADQGYTNAQFNLAIGYTNGIGMQRDDVQALKWWSLLAARGDPQARQGIDLLAARMTPTQIAEAQRLARAWRPKPE